jgi:hypothetical protein
MQNQLEFLEVACPETASTRIRSWNRVRKRAVACIVDMVKKNQGIEEPVLMNDAHTYFPALNIV